MEALEGLSARIVCKPIRVSQVLHTGRQVVDDDLHVLKCMKGCSLTWEKTHEDLVDLQSSGGDTCTFGPLQVEQLILCATILEKVNAVLQTTVLHVIQYGVEEK